MVPPDSLRISRVRRYSGYDRPTSAFVYGGVTLYAAASQLLPLASADTVMWSYNPTPETWSGLGYSPFARRYLGSRYYFTFLQVLRCFSSLRSPPQTYVFSKGLTGFRPAGFPHSEILGSTLVCSSPRLIAAYHVLHRLSVPRHPSHALTSLTTKSSRINTTQLTAENP